MSDHQMLWLTVSALIGACCFAVVEHIPNWITVIPGPRAWAVSLFVNGLLYVGFNLGRGTL